MKLRFPLTFGVLFSFLIPLVEAGSPCDLNSDGMVNALDVQLAVDQALGLTACTTGDINHDGVCNIVDVQMVISAALGGSCGTTAAFSYTTGSLGNTVPAPETCQRQIEMSSSLPSRNVRF